MFSRSTTEPPDAAPLRDEPGRADESHRPTDGRLPLPRHELVHDLNNVLGVVITCLDEQLELLDSSADLDRERLKKLAEDGLAAALRGAALTRPRPLDAATDPSTANRTESEA